jgi:hypothetical protein
MFEFCGKQFRVYKRADKTCDTIYNTGSRRMWDTVHLDDLRCSGSAHDGCQARCLLFWKEAWLTRVRPSLLQRTSSRIYKLLFASRPPVSPSNVLLRHEDLKRWTRVSVNSGELCKLIYACQATEVLRASSALPWWDVRQYFRDVCCGNASISDLVRAVFLWAFKKALKIGGYRALLWSYDRVQRIRRGVPYPYRRGILKRTPAAELNLQPGELVQVRSYEEILATLDQRNRNRGLSFDAEMVPYCGGKFRVMQRVERIIDEKTGEMNQLKSPCITMEGVKCRAWYSDQRVACPRSIYSYWREIWLLRVK